MNATAHFLTTLGQALASHGLYADGHPMRATARDRVRETLLAIIGDRSSLCFSFLDGSVVLGARVVPDLRGWEWGVRLAAVGVQRIEIDCAPIPGASEIEWLISELHQRLAVNSDHATTETSNGIRFGSLGIASARSNDERVGDLLDAMAQLPMTEEVEAMQWIHDEIAAGLGVPMAEVESVVHSLAMAMHREQHLMLPLLDIKTHDQYTTTHSCNVSMLAIGLAEQLGLSPSDARAIGTAALMHDIGKVLVPTEVLVKPGKLTDEEFAQMQMHPIDGARILSRRSRGHGLAATVAYEHHIWENEAGGYPMLRWPRRCHFASRLVHVCDLYDALSTRRPYRDAWPRERTVAMLQEQSGIEVDGEMVRAFIALLNRADEVRLMPMDVTPGSGWCNDVNVTARQMREAFPLAAGTA